MRRSGHPSRPRAITCCFFASLKTLLIPTKATALRRNQRPRASFSLAGFQVTLIGRFWVTTEGLRHRCRTHGIADLRCGDFQVGQRITSRCDVNYVGVDIVQAMVARNQISFGNDRISFLCADLAVDRLPDADLCLIRQVLQHLSNAEIHAVLENISHYEYALISEHVPKRPKF
jgi:Methyltransferase domain